MNSSIIKSIIGVSSILIFWVCATDYHAKREISRDYNYEHYCDSIYVTNQDYYLDVLVETDEYQDYIEKHGEWWD